MAKIGHLSAFPDQQEISAFLRTLLTPDLTQVILADRAGIPYNTLTNWFTEKPSRMSAESLLRIVIAAGAETRLRDWLKAGRDLPGLKLHDVTREAAGAVRVRARRTKGT